MDRGAWRATVLGDAESDTTEATWHTHTFFDVGHSVRCEGISHCETSENFVLPTSSTASCNVTTRRFHVYVFGLRADQFRSAVAATAKSSEDRNPKAS